MGVRSFSLQLHIPHPLNKVSNTTLNEVQENIGEISPCKILCPFVLLILFPKGVVFVVVLLAGCPLDCSMNVPSLSKNFGTYLVFIKFEVRSEILQLCKFVHQAGKTYYSTGQKTGKTYRLCWCLT